MAASRVTRKKTAPKVAVAKTGKSRKPIPKTKPVGGRKLGGVRAETVNDRYADVNEADRQLFNRNAARKRGRSSPR